MGSTLQMLTLLGLDKGYSTYESINGDLQHLCRNFSLCEKGCILGAKAVGTAVRCDREVRLQHLSFSCCILNLWIHGYDEIVLLAFGLFYLSAKLPEFALQTAKWCYYSTHGLKNPHRGKQWATGGEYAVLLHLPFRAML
jgi:hypothetical protein